MITAAPGSRLSFMCAIHAWMQHSVEDPHGYAKRLAAIQEATLMQSRDMLRLHSGHGRARNQLLCVARGEDPPDPRRPYD